MLLSLKNYCRRASSLTLLTLPTLVLLGVLGVGGCSEGPGRAAAVDSLKARDALKTSLEHWKSGGKLDDLKTSSPAITIQDLDWEGGKELVGFEILDEGKDDDANLRIPVALTIREKGGREQKKSVKYVVGTSPVITVFREIF